MGQQAFASPEERAAAFRTVWETLITSGKLGYMALLRNLRNILEADVSAQAVEKVCATLSNEQAVARAKQLPFRFLAAYREVLVLKSGYVALVLEALETAIAHSVANLRGFDTSTRVVVACDVSGSMQQPVSARSKVLLYDVGLVLGMLLQSRCSYVVTGMFGDTWKRLSLPGAGPCKTCRSSTAAKAK
ncbi:TROVE domain-containing protein [Hymenobacter cellulosilyticus]|uniref:TROVE domain-containing protein n=1 Tax=Hymenobacter cellulosilyticus TaxID=2932248 RepID=A0A8T9Q392_9BACT|nr:TROVE domain-containing protein [Hymenobacter cellulosilyticus]UOQ71442.1 TROVE domain-containing protein [Hymenobacter cellulosilyticus]